MDTGLLPLSNSGGLDSEKECETTHDSLKQASHAQYAIAAAVSHLRSWSPAIYR